MNQCRIPFSEEVTHPAHQRETDRLNETMRERIFERHCVRGRWNVSPLWEGKILLGVLREQGLAGKGLVEAFEKWAPRIIGSSRSDMNRVYSEQTGRQMSDYILVQQADKAVRYSQLPPEANGFRQALLKWSSSPTSQGEWQVILRGVPPEDAGKPGTRHRVRWTVRSARAEVLQAPVNMSKTDAKRGGGTFSAGKTMKRDLGLQSSERRLLDMDDSKVLLSTSELASLTGFKPKTIRRWVSRRLLNYIRVGNRFRFRPAAVELFLAQREVRK